VVGAAGRGPGVQETLAQSRAYSTAAGAVGAPPHMPLRQESVSDIQQNT
jgi:hypothetical protein